MIHMLVHDMRSPLMAIHLCLEAVQQYIVVGRTGTMKEDITSCMNVTTVVTEMVGTMMDMSRLEAGAMPLEISTSNVYDFMKDGVAQVSAGASVPIHISSLSLMVEWDKNLVTRTIANLVSNALKHGANKLIKVSCYDKVSMWRFRSTIPVAAYRKFANISSRSTNPCRPAISGEVPRVLDYFSASRWLVLMTATCGSSLCSRTDRVSGYACRRKSSHCCLQTCLRQAASN